MHTNTPMPKSPLRLLAASALVVLSLAGCEAKAPPLCGSDRAVVGHIDGEAVTCETLLAALYTDQGEAFFNRYAERRLVEREAERQKVEVDPARVAARVDQETEETISNRFGGSRKGLLDQIARYGLSFDAWRAGQIRDKRVDMLVEGMLRHGVADAQLQSVFEQRYGKGGRRVRVRQILVGTQPLTSTLYTRAQYDAEKPALEAEARSRATAAHDRLAQGEDFTAVAAALSDDWSAERGGDGGTQVQGRFGSAVDTFIQGAAPGSLSGVLESPKGFHVVQVAGRVAGGHFQGAHMLFSAKPAGPEDQSTAEARFDAARKKAEVARARVLAGEGFGEVAGQVTEDAATRDRNGDLGAFDTGRLGDDVDAVLGVLPLQTCSEPIRTETGYELVYLLGRELDPALDRKRVRHVLAATDFGLVKIRKLGKTIAADAKAAADGVLATLSAGGDFAALARERSEDETSRFHGGEMGVYRDGALGPEADAALATMKEGERRVVRSPRGFHVIELQSVVLTTFDSVRENLRKELQGRPVTGGEIKRFIDDLRAKARIEPAGGPTAAPTSAPPSR